MVDKKNQKLTIGTVCFIINPKKRKILLLKRHNEPMKNMFTGVGGKTNFFEDMNQSCIREIKEETGLYVKSVQLKGVIKTILEGKNSSWILFVYTTNEYEGNVTHCDEGELQWVDMADIYNQKLIGFIKAILPDILNNEKTIEGTIIHDMKGNVIQKNIKIN